MHTETVMSPLGAVGTRGPWWFFAVVGLISACRLVSTLLQRRRDLRERRERTRERR